MSGNGESKPIAIYYEQPNWFVPLFQQLDARGVNWLKLDARYHQYDAASPEREYSLLFNRMSPSAWQRGVGHGIFYTINYLKHLEDKGVRVVNGSRAFTASRLAWPSSACPSIRRRCSRSSRRGHRGGRTSRR